ncbi:Response regulator receiver domain-containing protein [Pedobacter westerhofensis]|uniref:Response regulator receiver domain-containing protein n=1 Tax=Pedobacter westerhofensis TaxID=425512 RepID=A0A521BFU7_9SPHI|nr:sigma 54-interacting transcriptional regulator [Pedobacter westerhofensis]SMO45811.1 Response regulator receiver domain-containing protein [Pedobacter westerhofensis]
MKEKILIVEDEFIVANDLRIMLEKAGYFVCGIAPSVIKALELINAKKPDWVLLDIFLQGDKTGIELAVQLRQMNLPFIYISANTNQATLEAAKATLPYGFMVKPFREKDLMVMLDIARYRHEQHQKYQHYEQPAPTIQIADILHKKEPLSNRLKATAAALDTVIPFDFLWISRARQKAGSRDIGLLKTARSDYRIFNIGELLETMCISKRDFKAWSTTAILNHTAPVIAGYAFKKLKMDNILINCLSDHFHFGSLLVKEAEREGEIFQFVFFNVSPDLYNSVHVDITDQYTKDFVLMLDMIAAEKELRTEKTTPVPVITETAARGFERSRESLPEFSGVIGNSKLLHGVFKKVALVAPDDTSVLILGESGTGKERIAHAIHKLSPRKSRAMVTVNCAALPLSLIESELFGHEKGAFTGAHEKRIGKFEQADGGSIFLDEIGELPLEAQAKLLRVLQEKEIERVGGNYTKKINVRIITATNRNLEKEVADGKFRLDLYYRLNVFPVELPPLRQRKEDIPVLVQHFIHKFSKGSPAPVTGISAAAMNELMEYNWPGNIRELEHLIERATVMTEGDTITTIELPAPHRLQESGEKEHSGIKTLEEIEREHILNILKICKGKIFGAGGAAELLNIPSTTLNSKIKKLGIRYEFEK